MAIKKTIGIISGSGQSFLKSIFDNPHIQKVIPYSELFDFCSQQVEGHEGILYKCIYGGLPIFLWSGRFHYYEGISLEQVVAPIFWGDKMGINTWIILNAAGAINPTFAPGDIMIIKDHINFLPEHPLRFLKNYKKPYTIYSINLISKALKIGNDFHVKIGTYACMPGPSLETKAECKFLRKIGVDAVGMSTVPEALTAAYLGHEVLAISFIANPATDLSTTPLSHHDVLSQINKNKSKFMIFCKKIIESLCFG